MSLPGEGSSVGPPSPEPRWGPVAGLLLTGLAMVTYFVLQLLVGVVWAVSSPGSEPLLSTLTSGLVASVSLLVAAPMTTAGLVLLLRWRGEPVRRTLGLSWPSLAQLAGWAAVTAVVIGGYEIAGRLLERPPVPPFMREVYATAGWLPLLYVAFVVAAPLFEEVAFRGFLLPRLADSPLGPPGAVGVTAALWAAVHLQYDPFDLSAVFALGLVFGAARHLTGSLWVPLALHAAVNLAAVIQTAWLSSGG